MNQPNKISRDSIASVAAGFLIAGIAALFTFGVAIALLSKMSWAAVFAFFPFLGIAFLAWGAIVSISNRNNGAMWGGTVIFTMFAMVSLMYYLEAGNAEQIAKREAAKKADIWLGESLATSRVIKNPTGPIDRLAVENRLCGDDTCGHALLHGLAREVVVISGYSITYYRLQPIVKCPTDNDTFAAFVEPLQKLGIFDACLRREKRVQSDPNSEIQNAVLISTQFNSRRVLRSVASKLENGRITEELARREYFQSHYANRSFGKRFSELEFLEALTGMEVNKDDAFVNRSFPDAVIHIKKKIGRIKMNYRAITLYLQRLLREARKKAGGPLIVTKATVDELQFVFDHLCTRGTTEIPDCTMRLNSLRNAYNLEVRP